MAKVTTLLNPKLMTKTRRSQHQPVQDCRATTVDAPPTMVKSKEPHDTGADSVILSVLLLGTQTTREQLINFFFVGRDIRVPKRGGAIRNIYSMVACHVPDFRCLQGAAEQRRGRRLRMTTSRRSRYESPPSYE